MNSKKEIVAVVSDGRNTVSPIYLLTTLYITHVIKFIPGSVQLFHTASDEKQGRRLHTM